MTPINHDHVDDSGGGGGSKPSSSSSSLSQVTVISNVASSSRAAKSSSPLSSASSSPPSSTTSKRPSKFASFMNFLKDNRSSMLGGSQDKKKKNKNKNMKMDNRDSRRRSSDVSKYDSSHDSDSDHLEGENEDNNSISVSSFSSTQNMVISSSKNGDKRGMVKEKEKRSSSSHAIDNSDGVLLSKLYPNMKMVKFMMKTNLSSPPSTTSLHSPSTHSVNSLTTSNAYSLSPNVRLNPYPHLTIVFESYQLSLPSLAFPMSSVSPRTPTFRKWSLHPGAKFEGLQQSNMKNYEVSVEILHVDLDDDFLCGYLNIKGLTEEYPSLTTFFEGEIIGPRHSFITGKWNTTPEIDFQHWEMFSQFEPYVEDFLSDRAIQIDPSKSDFLFMRWKEQFLAPDHTINNITGASYEGFYYVCLNLLTGQIEGYYFYQTAREWFEQLNLSYQKPERGSGNYFLQ